MPSSEAPEQAPLTTTAPTGAPPIPATVRRARRFYQIAAWLFAACVLAQVFIAGLAIFVGPAHWGWHRTFVHLFELLPLVMLVLAFVGRVPVKTRWLTGALFGSIIVQYATANGSGVLATLHPVSAMLLFWLAVTLASGTSRDGPAATARR